MEKRKKEGNFFSKNLLKKKWPPIAKKKGGGEEQTSAGPDIAGGRTKIHKKEARADAQDHVLELGDRRKGKLRQK